MLNEGTYEDVVNVHAPLAAMYGLTRSHQEAFTPWHKEMDVPFLERCMKWYKGAVEALGDGLGRAAFIAVEPMHSYSFGVGVADEDTAWPHARAREIVQVAIMPGAIPEDADEGEKQKMRDVDALCVDQIKKAVAEVPVGWRPSYPNYGDAAAGYTISNVSSLFFCGIYVHFTDTWCRCMGRIFRGYKKSSVNMTRRVFSYLRG